LRTFLPAMHAEALVPNGMRQWPPVRARAHRHRPTLRQNVIEFRDGIFSPSIAPLSMRLSGVDLSTNVLRRGYLVRRHTVSDFIPEDVAGLPTFSSSPDTLTVRLDSVPT
jgi:hypothetical protein